MDFQCFVLVIWKQSYDYADSRKSQSNTFKKYIVIEKEVVFLENLL